MLKTCLSCRASISVYPMYKDRYIILQASTFTEENVDPDLFSTGFAGPNYPWVFPTPAIPTER